MHETKKFSFIQAEQEKKTKSTKSSPDLSFEDVNKLLKHEIGHAKDFSYEFLNAIFSSVSDKMHCLKVNQLIISKDAVYAFWLLGSLGNHHEIQQVSCLSPPQEKRIFIFEKCLEPHQDVKSLFGIKSKSTPVNQLLIGFFPISNSSVGTNKQLVFMSRVLDFVLQQEWMKSDEAADIVNKGLMINFSKQSEHHEKSNISLGAEMYFVAMRGISDVFFQKICYWKACCLEGVAQDNKTDLRLKLIGLLLIQIKDISIQKNTLLFVVGKIKHMRDETPTIRAFREKSLMLTQSTDCRKQISCGDPAPEEMVAASMPVPQTLHPRMTCKKYFQLFLGLWSAVSIGNELYKKEPIQPLAVLNLLASVLGIIAIIALHHKKKENIDEVTQPRAKH